ncbi:hypothetical protein Tcan_04180 [Toxocara canis]|uniref:Uncharacterized protein n=1 Tax=Toxocara canis TaxID=6265 RepID=A0A0B2VWF2_TOXCA|nr:hypothetical protein Tcan_04180 [Toxocara canis]
MEVSDRDLRVYAEECSTQGATCYGKDGCKRQLKCQLCGHCLTYQLKMILRGAYEEHMSRRNMRRILPVSIIPRTSAALGFAQISPRERKLFTKEEKRIGHVFFLVRRSVESVFTYLSIDR